MTWQVVWTRPALKDMKRLEAGVAARVHAGVSRFAQTGHGDVVRLTDVHPPEWRLRVGELRVRFRLDAVSQELQVIRVLPRGDAYR